MRETEKNTLWEIPRERQRDTLREILKERQSESNTVGET